MATELSNNFVHLLAKKEIDFDADTFKVALMASGFVFNKATHDEYSDISTYELANGSGYTTGGATLGGVSVSRDDVNNLCSITWTNPSWTANGASLTTPGAIIYDDTVTGKPVVGYEDFGGNQTTPDQSDLILTNIEVQIAA